MMLSRWIQIRLRGSRKVPPGEKVRFVLSNFWDPVTFLKEGFSALLCEVLADLIHSRTRKKGPVL